MRELEAGENSDSSVSSVGAKISMFSLSDGSKTGEELHDERSESTNAKTLIRLDIGCITDEGPTQVKIEKCITIGHILLPRQSSNDPNKQAFPEITLKGYGTNGEMYKIEFLVWSHVKRALFCLSCRMFWHTTGVVSSRSALASPGCWTVSPKWRKLGVRAP